MVLHIIRLVEKSLQMNEMKQENAVAISIEIC